jgi:hypothetical protein
MDPVKIAHNACKRAILGLEDVSKFSWNFSDATSEMVFVNVPSCGSPCPSLSPFLQILFLAVAKIAANKSSARSFENDCVHFDIPTTQSMPNNVVSEQAIQMKNSLLMCP